MKKKEEIYVVIDTPKKAKKVKKLLDMFGEKIEIYTNKTLVDYNQPWTTDRDGVPALFYSNRNGFIGEHVHSIKYRERVSIKELRNILAIEHLKEGDVIVVKNGSGKWIVKLTGNNIDRFEHSASYNLDLGLLKDEKIIERHNKIYGASFIRYATEEEKALLEEKPKELTKEEVEKKVVEYAVSVNWEYESLHNYIGNRISIKEYDTLEGRYTDDKVKVIIEKFKPKSIEAGKWYTFAWDDQPNEIRGIYFIEKVEDVKVWFSYGINVEYGEWVNKDWYSLGHVWKEATKEEVEQAFIKESKKRGYVEGARVKCLLFEQEYTLTSEKHWNDFNGQELLMVEKEGTGVWIFKNGKWAEIVEPVKPVINGKDLKVVLDGKPLRCESNEKLETKDIAVIEQLHDLLLDVHGYSLDYKLLRDARELAQKLTKLI